MSRLVAVVLGTRPEALKLLPLVNELRSRGHAVLVCATYQHTHLLDQVFDLFATKPDICLGLMQHDQTLAYITASVITQVSQVLTTHKPACVVVQGDTASAYGAAMAAFYQKIPVVHVEAGLRSQHPYEPFPEEMLRRMITQCASWHCAPTLWNVATLVREGVARDRIVHTGNTIVDTLYMVRKHIIEGRFVIDDGVQALVQQAQAEKRQLVLMTAHRRESFGQGLSELFQAVTRFVCQYPSVHIVFPVHPNPAVQTALASSGLDQLRNVTLLSPLTYDQLVYLLMSVAWVITDSGGIQEEAVTLGKPLVIARKVTERPELLWEERGLLVGTDPQAVFQAMQWVARGALSMQPSALYGDGYARIKIADLIAAILEQQMQRGNQDSTHVVPGVVAEFGSSMTWENLR